MLFFVVFAIFAKLALAFPDPQYGYRSSSSFSSYERVVTQEEALRSGVPVDYLYNESISSSPQGVSSVPGCPRSVDGYPWVYFGSPLSSRCYLAGMQGPCPVGQKLFVEKGDPFGFCNCDCFEDIEMDTKGPFVRGQSQSQSHNQAIFCFSPTSSREVAFFPSLKKCYTLYEQGPCREGEWFAKTTPPIGFPITFCEKRQCREGEVLASTYEGSRSGECIFAGYGSGGYGGAASDIQPHNCGDHGMRYSRLLQMCVKRFKFYSG